MVPQRVNSAFKARLVCALMSLLSAGSAFSEVGLDVDYAEMQPLADSSLLLDIVRLDNGRLVAVGERGHIVYSDDGSEWAQAEHVPTRSTLTTVVESDGRLWAAGHDSVILTSPDQGQSWTVLYMDIERRQPIMDIYFSDRYNGKAVGAYGLMMTTTDGGQSWDDIHVSDDEWHLNALLPLEDGQFIIAAEAGYSYRSLDNGETWEEIEMPYPGSMFGIAKAPNNCVIVFGLRGNAQQSCDLGFSWEELDTGTEASLSGGVTIDNTTILVGNTGAILVRDDSRSFRTMLHPSGVDFSSIVSIGDGRYLLVGEDGVHEYPPQDIGGSDS